MPTYLPCLEVIYVSDSHLRRSALLTNNLNPPRSTQPLRRHPLRRLPIRGLGTARADATPHVDSLLARLRGQADRRAIRVPPFRPAVLFLRQLAVFHEAEGAERRRRGREPVFSQEAAGEPGGRGEELGRRLHEVDVGAGLVLG